VLALLQQNPIVVEVLQQPPVTEPISYGSVLLTAVGMLGLILAAGLVTGALVGGLFILRRRRADASAPPTDPGHARLRI